MTQRGERRGGRAAADRTALALFALALLGVTGALGALGGDTPLPALLLGGALGLLGALAAWRRPVPPVFWSGAALVLALFALAVLRGGLPLAGPELAALVGAGGAFAVGAGAGRETGTARRATGLLTWWLLLMLALAFVQHAADPGLVLGRPKPYHEGRLTGPFLSANTMATLCALALCVGVGGATRAGRGAHGMLSWLDALGRRGLGAGLLCVFAIACLLLTGSRAGIAAGLFGTAWIGTWQVRANRAEAGTAPGPSRALLFLVPVAGLVLALASLGVLSDRLAGVGTDGNGRLVLWRASLGAFAEAPLFGHGLGAFPRALARQVTLETAPVLSVQNAAHNLALQWLVQTGIVGTLAGAAVLGHLVRTLARGLRRRRRSRAVIRVGVVALGAALSHGCVDYALEVPGVLWTLSLLVGLAAGAAKADHMRDDPAQRRDRL